MKIEKGGITYWKDTQTEEKIRQGYGWYIDDRGWIRTTNEKTNFDLEAFICKLKEGKASLKDINEYLLSILK